MGRVFYAHNGLAAAASPVDRETPILAFLIASWLPDLTGVGHWLPIGAALAVVAFIVGRRRWSTRVGIALGLLVLSHLVLDLVVGLQIWPGGRFIGLNLSTHSGLELALELVAVVAGYCIYALRRRPITFPLAISFVLTVGFAFAVWSFPDDPEDHNPSPAKMAVGLTGLAVTSTLLIVADRRPTRSENDRSLSG